MTSSLTITFSEDKSVLQSNFHPEIMLNEEYDHSCALLDLVVKAKSVDDLKKILDSEVKYIKCDIISGSYINGMQNHAIHQFTRSTPIVKGDTFVEIPKHLNYFPVKSKILQSIQICIVNKNGEPIDIYSAHIICRIHIKREKKSA